MASRIRNDDWKDDEGLKRDLEKYIKQSLKRKEVLDFVSSKYPMYTWSLRTLGCCLSRFNIKYTNYEIELMNNVNLLIYRDSVFHDKMVVHI